MKTLTSVIMVASLVTQVAMARQQPEQQPKVENNTEVPLTVVIPEVGEAKTVDVSLSAEEQAQVKKNVSEIVGSAQNDSERRALTSKFERLLTSREQLKKLRQQLEIQDSSAPDWFVIGFKDLSGLSAALAYGVIGVYTIVKAPNTRAWNAIKVATLVGGYNQAKNAKQAAGEARNHYNAFFLSKAAREALKVEIAAIEREQEEILDGFVTSVRDR